MKNSESAANKNSPSEGTPLKNSPARAFLRIMNAFTQKKGEPPLSTYCGLPWNLVSVFLFVLLLAPWSASGSGGGYFQWLPINNFIKPDPSYDYLHRQPPDSPWKPLAARPTPAEQSRYKELLARAEYENQSVMGSPKAPSAFGNWIAEVLATKIVKSLDVPPLGPWSSGVDGTKRSSATSKDIIKPWIIMSPYAPSQSDETTISTDSRSGLDSAPPPVGVLRRPVGTSDVYIPFPVVPGVQPPPATSAVIYTQPEQ